MVELIKASMDHWPQDLGYLEDHLDPISLVAPVVPLGLFSLVDPVSLVPPVERKSNVSYKTLTNKKVLIVDGNMHNN